METPLGKSTQYRDGYAPELLAPMSRAEARAALGLGMPLPFRGEDLWNGYEFSWLDTRGVPQVAGVRFSVTAASPCFVESKSLKNYLASFRNHGAFHEACTLDIAQRLVRLLDPAWLRIGGYWYPRGGIPIDAFWQSGAPPDGVWIPAQEVSSYRGRG